MKVLIIHKLWKQDLDFIEEIILDGLTEEDAFNYEIQAIAAYGRININTGCLANMTNGGYGTSGYIPTEEQKEKVRRQLKGRPLSQEHRKKLSISHIGIQVGENHPMYWGKKMPAEIKEKLIACSHARKGIKQSEEFKEKIRIAMTGKKFPGRKLSEEHKQNIRKALKGRIGKPLSEEHKEKLSKAFKGRKLVFTEDHKQAISKAAIGRKLSDETKAKISLSLKRNRYGQEID